MTLETMTEAIARLEAAGYRSDFRAVDGRLRCTACGTDHEPESVTVDEIVRFEGPTDPGDEAVLFAITCGACGTKGTYAVAFGPSMDAADVDVVRRLPDGR